MNKANTTLNLMIEALETSGGKLRFEQAYFDLVHAQSRPDWDSGGLSNRIGPSSIGTPCDRRIWLNYRWASVKPPSAKQVRIYQRGYVEEPRIVAQLLVAGLDVDTVTQRRFSSSFGQFGGAADGFISCLPETNRPALLEMKSASDKSFNWVASRGVEKGKHDHYQQMQQYMGAFNIHETLYVITNKNDEDIHAEVVTFNPEVYEADKARVERILVTNVMPEGVDDCRWCDHAPYCHGNKPLHVSCRTCQHGEVVEGKWLCQLRKIELRLTDQKQACVNYKETAK